MTTTIPTVLVTTDWVAQHATDAAVRVVEVDVDTTAYQQGHVPGAIAWNWTTGIENRSSAGGGQPPMSR